MSIKPIDMQIIIPKTAEINKIKQTEINSDKSNAQAMNQKGIESQNKAIKQVNKPNEAYKSKIDKDGSRKDLNRQNKKKDNNSEKDEKNKKNDFIESHSKLDIRI